MGRITAQSVRSAKYPGVAAPLASAVRVHRCALPHAGRTSTGAVGRVSRARLRTTSSPLLHSTILLFATKSRCASMAWGSTVYGVAGLVIYFEGQKVVQWVLAHWLVLSCIHSLEPTKTSQATPGVSVARLFPWVFSQLTSRGGAGSDSSGIQSSQCRTCHQLGDRFLSAPAEL